MSYESLISTAPTVSHGMAMGFDDWRFVVEALLPDEEGAVVGVAKVGTTKVASTDPVWRDITGYVRGLEWTRGAAEYGGRPEVGTCTITLASTDHEFAPWYWSLNSFGGFGPAFRPGLVIRVACISPTLLAENEPYTPVLDPDAPSQRANDYILKGWLPQFCGVVELWPEETVGVGADAFVNVTLVETTSLLAKIDEDALGSAIAANFDEAQVRSLLTLSDWQFGTYQPIGVPLVWCSSTTAALNRHTEVQLIADSGASVFRADRTGMARYVPRAGYRYRDEQSGFVGADKVANLIKDYYSGTNVIPLAHTTGVAGLQPGAGVVYVADSLRYAADDSAILNDVSATNGVSSGHAEDTLSIARYGRRSLKRTDLRCYYLADVQGFCDGLVSERANLIRRIDSVALNIHNPNAWPAIGVLDYDDGVEVIYSPPGSAVTIQAAGSVRGYSHFVTPLPEGIIWEASLLIDTGTTTITED